MYWRTRLVPNLLCFRNFYTSLYFVGNYFNVKYWFKVSQPRGGVLKSKVSNMSSKMHQMYLTWTAVINLAQLLLLGSLNLGQ